MDDFRKLLNDVRAGSAEAARQLVDEYGPFVQRAMRRVLDGSRRVRLQFDTADFTQPAWAMFFCRCTQWNEIETPQQLVKLLFKLATNELRDRRRHFDVEGGRRRTVSLDEAERKRSPTAGLRPTTRPTFATAWKPYCKAVPPCTAGSWNFAAAGTRANKSRRSSDVASDTSGGCCKKYARNSPTEENICFPASVFAKNRPYIDRGFAHALESRL